MLFKSSHVAGVRLLREECENIRREVDDSDRNSICYVHKLR